MERLRLVRAGSLTALALAAVPAPAALAPADLAGIGATPAVGARLPIGLAFVDQAGRAFRLGAAPEPILLLFADYSCRHICGPGVTLTAGALHDAGLRAGDDYRMIVIGLDQDGPPLARRLAADRLRGLPAEAAAMRLLTGAPGAIARAETALGYHVAYDPQADQFAHDAALYVFTGDGRLSAVLPETGSTPPQLAAAVAAARAGAAYQAPPARRGTGLADRISALCYGLASAHGVYAGAIVAGLRIGGALICLALATFLIASVRRNRKAGDAA